MKDEVHAAHMDGALDAHTFAASRAATELGLKRGEFELAVHLGIVQVEAQPNGGRPRVRRVEIDRLRSEDGFPAALRERVRTVGTAEGARLMGISPVRFTRLARAGCVTPVAFYLNRYRAVVWLYLAQELGRLAARSPELLVGRSPAWMRSRLDAGTDCRPRNWRSRRIERLLTLNDDPWARAAVAAEALDPVQLAEVVDDPYERAYFVRVRPEPVFGHRGSQATREAMGRLMLADEPDEILWRRVNLLMELDSARELRQAPRPGEELRPAPAPLGRQAEPDEPTEPAALAKPMPPEPGALPVLVPMPPESAVLAVPMLPEPGALPVPVLPEPAVLPERAALAESSEPATQGTSTGLLTRLRLRRGRGKRRPQERPAQGAAPSTGSRPSGRNRRLPGPSGDARREDFEGGT
ncbi:DUF6397 family protein [Streptomyces sp. NPDC091265]|uniref:DUF6397 family protein n=1 Tax=Streptomyces sp. NPDC091265 TaxID=3365977 RepID=UPI00382A3A44